MGYGLIEETAKSRRRGLTEPWLADSFLADLSPNALCRLEGDEVYAKASLKKYRPMAARNEDKKVFSGLL